MRKSAKSLLLIGALVVSGGLWAQQTPVQQNPPQQNQPQQNPPQQNPPQQKSTNQERQSEPTTTLRVDVNLVNVFVTVTDEHGAPIGGLTKENFILKEDDREQRIAVFDKESALPISIALAVDTSLSTRHDLPLEQASAKRFAH